MGSGLESLRDELSVQYNSTLQVLQELKAQMVNTGRQLVDSASQGSKERVALQVGIIDVANKVELVYNTSSQPGKQSVIDVAV